MRRVSLGPAARHRRRLMLAPVASIFAISAMFAPSAAADPPGRTLHVARERLADVPETSQHRTISSAAAAARAGDTVVIHEGVYREGVVVDRGGTADLPIRFEAAPFARVVVDGADVLKGWREEASGNDKLFSVPWPHQFIGWSKTRTHPGDDKHLLIGRAEQVFVQGFPLRQVLQRGRMERGTFFVDESAKRLFAWGSGNEDLNGVRVEASVRSLLWDGRGDHVRVRGLTFRHAANAAQQGATIFRGRGDVIEDCTFELANSSGATFVGPGQVVRRCVFQDNGQLGWGAAGAHDLLMTDCTTRRNNAKNFERGWEAGGDKVVLSRGVVIEHSRFENNNGAGVWFDIGNEGCTVRNCLIADNQDAGIFYEISFGLHATDNVILGNGHAETPGAWGAAAGICLSSSPGCLVERNLIVGNREGFNFREQGRTTPRIGAAEGAKEEPVWNHDQTIRNNIFADNTHAQVRGWWDVDDDRHWPASSPLRKEPAKGGMSLEDLHITFADNVYDPPAGRPPFQWGVEWKPNRAYQTLDKLRAELGFEKGGRIVPLAVRDALARDLRLAADAPAVVRAAYPRGEVPGVRLGIEDPGDHPGTPRKP